MKASLIGNANSKIDGIASAQIEPFFLNRKRLQEEINLTFEHAQAVSIEDIVKASLSVTHDVEVLFIRPDWREEASKVVQALRTIRSFHPTKTIIFIDPWDQVSSRFFGVLPYVNKFLKYQHFKDLSRYQETLIGGTAITDYLAKEKGYDIGDFHVSSEIPAGYEHRITTGWNVVTAKRFKQVLFQSFLWKLKHRELGRLLKDIDIFCHLSYASVSDSHNWYTDYRKTVINQIQTFSTSCTLAVSGEYPEHRTISTQKYFEDLRRSRIVIAPFGWGETTWRDYEAVCYNCLLIKPDMSHIATAPDIYDPYETYVPVKWDFSDLEEKCAYYLANPQEADRIVKNARRSLEDYFLKAEFVKAIGNLIFDQSKIVNSATAELSQLDPDKDPAFGSSEEILLGSSIPTPDVIPSLVYSHSHR
jgi:Glycosyl transferases group 1